MKKFSSLAKSVLFATVLLVTVLGMAPATSHADWELVCSGPGDYCGTVTDYDLGIRVSVYGWAFESFTVW
jgi:hypothetical protein